MVIDTSDETTLMLSEERAGEDSDHDDDPSSENVEDDGAGTSTVVESSDHESSSRSRSSTPVNAKGKKRKRSKGEIVEDVMSKVMKSVTEGLKESDKMFLELEEKRMKFEEQQKREERQFQLQMMQILVGSSNSTDHQSNPTGQYHPMYSPFVSQCYPRSGEGEDFN